MDLRVSGTCISCLIDTGFTGPLAIGLDVARLLNIHPHPAKHISDTAGGDAGFRVGHASIEWFDQHRGIDVFVWDKPSIGPLDGLIGVQLLVGYALIVDFNEGDVLIKDPSTG